MCFYTDSIFSRSIGSSNSIDWRFEGSMFVARIPEPYVHGVPVEPSIVLADKVFGQVNDAEILVIVTTLTLASRVDISGWSMCSTNEIRKSVRTYI